MPSVVPHRFLFRYSIPVRKIARLPKKGSQLLNLPGKCTLPDFGELDDHPAFGDVRIAWNDRGLGVSATVSGKKHPVICDAALPDESDGLQLWIDTRNTQSIHRASRFCHHFCLLPAGGGRNAQEPTTVQLPIARAREEVSLANPKDLTIRVGKLNDGYHLEAWLPAKALNGFDPEDNSKLGFYYYLRDSELGDQFLTVGHEFPFAHDPSLWATLESSPS